ncbi:MAG: TonB C-terminal domain-containing protein [Burkholderiaceae bacterium]|nr:TonB C-terminal domain-containing protein [Burkholderiaceae bacterium]
MTAAALPPPRRPRTRHDTLPSLALALLMHALLFGAIAFVVRWNTGDPGPVVAELWPAPPAVDIASPAPPPAPALPPRAEDKPPPRPQADIAVQPEKKTEEKKPPPKKEEAKQDPLADLLKKQEAREREQREKLRQAEAERILAQMAADRAAGASQPAAGGSARDAEYRERLAALIRSRIVYAVPEGTAPSVYADVQVELLPSGEVAAIRFLKPSGLPGYDEAVERAIRRTDPFPRKPDGTIDRTIVIRFRPVDTPR